MLMVVMGISAHAVPNGKPVKTVAHKRPELHKVIIQDDSPITNIKWSPDNIHIATYSSYVSAGKYLIKIWNAVTGVLVVILESPTKISDFTWSYDGKKIALTHGVHEVWIVDVAHLAPGTAVQLKG